MQYAVVTGSTKGLGRAIAERLLLEGFHVIVNYASDEQAAKEFLNSNSQYLSNITCIKADLSKYEEAMVFVQKVLDITQDITCLILNCGATDRSKFTDITKESWERVFNVNVNVPFYIVQGLEKHLCDETGRIIFIGSICGQYPHARSLGYGVSKAAVHQMAKELVKFFADRKITCNAVVPGFIDTPWQLQKPQNLKDSICKKTALHRFAYPEEIADLCWSVIKNQFINGSVINIDGGYCYK